MKIASHLHKTLTVTEEEDNRISLPVIIMVKCPPWIQHSTVNPLQSLPRRLLTAKDSLVKPLSSEKPDDLTGTWMQRRRRQGNTHRTIWCNLHITTSKHVNTPDEERLQVFEDGERQRSCHEPEEHRTHHFWAAVAALLLVRLRFTPSSTSVSGSSIYDGHRQKSGELFISRRLQPSPITRAGYQKRSASVHNSEN